jgi:hypothetical protein
MMSDRDVEDVELLVIAAARRENHWRWTVLRRAGRSPWSSGTKSAGLAVFLVGSRLRFSPLCTLTRLLDAHDLLRRGVITTPEAGLWHRRIPLPRRYGRL